MSKQTVIIALYPGCISYEVALVAEILSQKYQILNVTPAGHDLIETSGLPLKAQLSYKQVDLKNCHAVLVPGGNAESLSKNNDIDRILVEANDSGLFIGGICAGPSVLAKAGILKGRKIAHGYNKNQLEDLKNLFVNVTLTNELFVADGNIITAKAEAHIEFAVEIACRLDVVDAPKVGRLKDYYRGILERKIRPVALALLRNKTGQILLSKGYDSLAEHSFYRPLGGGIEFHESGKDAVVREIYEELGMKVVVRDLIHIYENIFTYEGMRGHEIVMLFETEFEDDSNYDHAEIDIHESGKIINKAVWKSIEDIHKEGAKLYPHGIEKVLSNTIN